MEPLPTVLLRHDLPDGSWHVDWMLGQDPAGTRPLVSYRAPRRLDELAAGERVEIERIGEHRPAYLDYEGPLSRGRGSVRRLVRGRIVGLAERPGGGLDVEVVWSAETARGAQRLRLERLRGDSWQVTCVGHGPVRSAP